MITIGNLKLPSLVWYSAQLHLAANESTEKTYYSAQNSLYSGACRGGIQVCLRSKYVTSEYVRN